IDKMLFYASPNAADYAASGLLDLVRQASETHVRCLYYSDGTAIDTQIMAAAYASRALSTNFSGSLTAQTLHMKSLAGVTADTTVDQTQLALAQSANVDIYTSIGNISLIFQSGQNSFFDEIYNELWLKLALQTA